MKIVQLANFYAPTSGGLRVAVDALRDGYHRAGHDCVLVVPGVNDGIAGTVRTVRSPALPNGSGYRMIIRRRAVLALLDELAPDRVEAHDKMLQHWVWEWSRRRDVPVVAVSHERLADSLPMLLPVVPRSVLQRVAARIAERTERECDRLITCSRFAAAEFHSADVVRLGVDLGTFSPRPAQRRVGRVRLVVSTRLSSEKSPMLAVETLRALLARGVDTELTVLGTGPLASAVRRATIGLPVSLVGHVRDPAVVATFLRAADVAIAPGPVETFGLAALEALACGTPIVAVDRAAAAEFVERDPRAGRGAAPNAAGFADAVQALVDIDPDERGAAARRVAERYAWSNTVDALIAVHEQASERYRRSERGRSRVNVSNGSSRP